MNALMSSLMSKHREIRLHFDARYVRNVEDTRVWSQEAPDFLMYPIQMANAQEKKKIYLFSIKKEKERELITWGSPEAKFLGLEG